MLALNPHLYCNSYDWAVHNGVVGIKSKCELFSESHNKFIYLFSVSLQPSHNLLTALSVHVSAR